MNKRYIDFVPAKGGRVPKKGRVVGAKVAKKPAAKPVVKPAVKKTAASVSKKLTRRDSPLEGDLEIDKIFAERVEPAGVTKGGAKLGVIEDFQPKFVQAEVKKRPLGASNTASKVNVSTKASSKVVSKAPRAGTSTRVGVSVRTGTSGAAKAAKAKAGVTGMRAGVTISSSKRPLPMGNRTAFLSNSKIEKRPLSKNAYIKRPVVIPKEEKPQAPVKIIAKPEKDSKAGLIIAIILTIILGAAAGTVAFLLLPK